MFQFDFLPREVISEIALRLPLSSISYCCQVSKKFNEAICNNDLFWSSKFSRDFMNANYRPVDYTGNWKQMYRSFMNVWVYGHNDKGQLGLGDVQDRNVPTQIPGFKAKQVSAGNDFTAVIDIQDNVWVCGLNAVTGLNIGDTQNRNVFMKMPADSESTGFKAKQVSCGSFFMSLIDLNNNVWICGLNTRGELGLGDVQNRNMPTQIPDFKASQVSSGFIHSALIDLDNNVWIWGGDWFNDGSGAGFLGLGVKQDRNIPTQIPNLKAKQISCGHNITAIIDLENNVWTFGSNRYGQLGLGDNQNRNVPTQIVIGSQSNFKAKQVSCGYNTIMIDLNDNV